MENVHPVGVVSAPNPYRPHEGSLCSMAFMRAVVSLCFALLISLTLFVLPSMWQIDFLRSKGSDAGMRIIANPHLSPLGYLNRSKNPFYSIELDYEACIKFYRSGDSAGKCKLGAPPPPELLVAVLKAVDEAARPAIIIVDFELPSSSDEGAAALITLLTKPDGAPIIAPAPLRPANQVGVTSWYSSGQLIDGLDKGRLRLAAFTTWTDNRVGDGVVRAYPPVVQVNDMGPTDPARRYVPSAPFLAALILSENGHLQGVDRAFYPSSAASECQFITPHTATILEVWLRDLPSNCPRSTRGLTAAELEGIASQNILYTVLSIAHAANTPALSGDIVGNGRTVEDAYSGGGSIRNGMLYLRAFASKDASSETPFRNLAIDINKRSEIGPNTPEGAGMIVLIGSTAMNSGDWHATPLGLMAGTEVVMNAIRAFHEFQPLEAHPHPITALLLEVLFGIVAVATLFPFILAMIFVERVARRHASGKNDTAGPDASFAPLGGQKLRRLGTNIAFWLIRTLIYLAGTVLAVLAVSQVNYLMLWQFGFHMPVDFLLPVVAVVFAGLVEIAKEMIEGLEIAIEWLFGRFQRSGRLVPAPDSRGNDDHT